jgi:hypothetical protein
MARMLRAHLCVPTSAELFLTGVAADELSSGENTTVSSVAWVHQPGHSSEASFEGRSAHGLPRKEVISAYRNLMQCDRKDHRQYNLAMNGGGPVKSGNRTTGLGPRNSRAVGPSSRPSAPILRLEPSGAHSMECRRHRSSNSDSTIGPFVGDGHVGDQNASCGVQRARSRRLFRALGFFPYDMAVRSVTLLEAVAPTSRPMEGTLQPAHSRPNW